MKKPMLYSLLAVFFGVFLCSHLSAQPASSAGNALSFGGSNYVDASAFSWGAGGPITIEFWNKVDAAPSGASSAFSIGNQDVPLRIQAHVPWTDNTLFWDYGGNLSGPNDGRLTANYSPYYGKWTHVALVSAGNGGSWMAIYLNGTLVNSYTGSTVGPSFTASGATIGAYHPSSGSCFHQGTIDEFRVWSVVRTQAQIQHDMRSSLAGTESGLIGYWRFDEGAGDTTADITGKGATGTRVNSPTWIVSGAQFPVPFFHATPSSLNFGTVGVGSSKTDTVIVTNTGGDTLRISSVSSSDAVDFSVAPGNGTIAPSDSLAFAVTYTPGSIGTKHTSVIFTHNASTSPDTVRVTGWAGVPPHVAVSPDSLTATLGVDTTTKTLTISNTGENELTFTISIQDHTAAMRMARMAASAPRMTGNRDEQWLMYILKANEQVARQGRGQSGAVGLAANKPVAHTMRTAEEIRDLRQRNSCAIPGTIYAVVLNGWGSSNAAYCDWDDLNAHWSSYGTQSILIDYSTFNGVPITYDALKASGADVVIVCNNWNPAYGTFSVLDAHAVVQYVSGGAGLYVSAGTFNNKNYAETQTQVDSLTPLVGLSASASYNWATSPPESPMNFVLPAHPLLKNLSSPFTTCAGFTVRPYGDAWTSTYIPTGTVVARSTDNTTVLVAYENRVYVSSLPEECNDTKGEQFMYNAIGFCGGQWLSVTPNSGRVTPGDSAKIKVKFDSRTTTPGDYAKDIVIANNDPTDTSVTVLARLHVNSVREISVSDTALDFGPAITPGENTTRRLTISNAGNDSLRVSHLSLAGSTFSTDTSSFVLGPGRAKGLLIKFSPSIAGTITGTLTITSNDPNRGTVAVTLHGICATYVGPGKALTLNGSSQYVSVPLDEPETEITHELWFKTSNANGGLFSIIDTALGGHDRHIYLSGGDIWTRVYSDEVIHSSGMNYADGHWHHVAHVIGSSVGGQILYVDGIQVTKGTKTCSDFNWQTTVLIGWSADAANSLEGQIDEVRVWSVARTRQQIRENMHLRLHGDEPGLLGYWRFDEGAGGMAYDATANGHDGRLHSSPAWVVSTVPLGTGSSSSVTSFTSGTQTLGTVKLTSVVPFSLLVDITETQIMVSPDSLPAGSTTILNDRYWVISVYDTTAALSQMKPSVGQLKKVLGRAESPSVSLTFTVPQGFTNKGYASASLYQLYQRSGTSENAWSTELSAADSLTVTTVNYGGVSTFGQFALGTNDALPIQLASLTATTAAKSVKLEWTTISETNNYGFYVERKPQNGVTFATVSDLIPGANTSLEEHHYSWTDSTVTVGNYAYRLQQVDLNGAAAYSRTIVVSVVLGVNNDPAPKKFQLLQNYPNPFNPSATIKFSVEHAEHATLIVYDVLGQEVARLFDGVAEPGHYYRLTFDGSRVGSGLYIYRIVTSSHTDVKKMVLLK